MAEKTKHCSSLERARNEAIRWLESKGVRFGPYREIEIGRLERSALNGKEVGVRSPPGHRPFWRLRLDYDPTKGCHFNAEIKGQSHEKIAFCFPGDESLIRSLAQGRNPR